MLLFDIGVAMFLLCVSYYLNTSVRVLPFILFCGTFATSFPTSDKVISKVSFCNQLDSKSFWFLVAWAIAYVAVMLLLIVFDIHAASPDRYYFFVAIVTVMYFFVLFPFFLYHIIPRNNVGKM